MIGKSISNVRKVNSTELVQNLNARFLNGKESFSFPQSRGYFQFSGNWNTLISNTYESGYYDVTEGTGAAGTGAPPSAWKYGKLIIFNGYYQIQIFIPSGNRGYFLVRAGENQSFSQWQQFSGTSAAAASLGLAQTETLKQEDMTQSNVIEHIGGGIPEPAS